MKNNTITINKTKFTIIKSNTRRGHNLINAYERSRKYSLEDAYKSHSAEKEWGFRECERIKGDMEGEYGRIIGFNSCFFSYAFKLPEYCVSEEGYDLGDHIIYITAAYNYIIL